MDLILRGGRVIDPASNLDATRDVGFAERPGGRPRPANLGERA